MNETDPRRRRLSPLLASLRGLVLLTTIAVMATACGSDTDSAISEVPAIEVIEQSAVEEPVSIDELVDRVAAELASQNEFRSEAVDRAVADAGLQAAVAEEMMAMTPQAPVVSDLTMEVDRGLGSCEGEFPHGVRATFDYRDDDGDLGLRPRVDAQMTIGERTWTYNLNPQAQGSSGTFSLIVSCAWFSASGAQVGVQVTLTDQAGNQSEPRQATTWYQP